MRAAAIALLALAPALAACEPDPRTTAPVEEEVVEAPAPAPTDPRRFLGRWAETADECTTDWYRFYGNELISASSVGLQCAILPPDADFSDMEIRVACRQQEGGIRETWQLNYAEDGEQMTILRENGETLTELVKCA